MMGKASFSEESPSQFYFACRNNEMKTVQSLLDKHPLESLDQMEPNGSTALHAACYFKHLDIIKLLLDRGFTRRVLNKYNNTPLDESETEEIRQLFSRSKTSNRFGGNIPCERERLTWILIDGTEQNHIRDRVPDNYHGNRLEYGLFQGDKILQQLADMPKIDVIRRLFRRATDEKDYTRLVQAYTTDTDFSNRVNNYLISPNEEMKSDSCTGQSSPMSQFIDTIYFNRQLHEKYPFQGVCYRTMNIQSHNELNVFKVDAKIINRTFLSATKDRAYAEQYIRERKAAKENIVIISFQILLSNSALDLESLSEFSNEKEVLIMNNRVFRVVTMVTDTNLDVKIELRESKSTKVYQRDSKSGLLGFFSKK